MPDLPLPMRTLLIDNHDSFTYNLAHLLAQAYGVAPRVLPNDDPELTAELAGGFDAVVVSPGPGRPDVARDVGRCLDVIRAIRVPVLGVCLGHQALGHLVGTPVSAAPQPRHGHLTAVTHQDTGLFAGLPQSFTAVRYHSLCLAEPLPEQLSVDAWSEDDVVMAVHHVSQPWWGVQFHPESVASEHGEQLLGNFRALVADRRVANTTTTAAPAVPDPPSAPGPRPAGWTLRTHRLPYAVDTETAFARLCASRPYAFWLDSCHPHGPLARFTFLGHPGGPGGEVLTSVTTAPDVDVLDANGRRVTTLPGPITAVLEGRLRERRVDPEVPVPFDLTGGYVGYFGYESGAGAGAGAGGTSERVAATPDAVWVFASRLVAVDHQLGETWLVAVSRTADDEIAMAEQWLEATADALPPRPPQVAPGVAAPSRPVDPEPLLTRSRRDYIRDVTAAQAELRAGESYEVCLTAEASGHFIGAGLATYLRQRRLNPAPYSAFLRLGAVEVLCSSPERFLRIKQSGRIESRPIKGTARRGVTGTADTALAEQLATSAKTRAENLMIVDLLRNDLGRVCETRSVHVPSFMAVETYATVHQLVSTVRGQLRSGVGAVEAVRACFPGGSMTGAPKLRTMEIIDRLEGRARGVYSGTLGYFGLAGGADLNIVIRTVVLAHGVLRAGAGGAIVLDSDPGDEWEEMLLKLRATLCGVRSQDVADPPPRVAQERPETGGWRPGG